MMHRLMLQAWCGGSLSAPSTTQYSCDVSGVGHHSGVSSSFCKTQYPSSIPGRRLLSVRGPQDSVFARDLTALVRRQGLP